jgi:Reverse transcriptase (RNA-dependent DNA polymerase)
MSQNWPLSQSINKSKGICSVCKAVRQLHLKDGTVHQHGPRKNPCAGSHKAPLSVSSQPTTTVTFSTLSSASPKQHLVVSSSSTTGITDSSQLFVQANVCTNSKSVETNYCSFDHPNIDSPIIKHIPKSVRHTCCMFLSQQLFKLCSAPDDLNTWKLLLDFGKLFLVKPSRAGKHHNLSSVIKKRFADFESNLTQPINTQSRARASKYGTSTLANLVASKIEDGNISAAVRLLCSDDQLTNDSDEVFADLIKRHPPAAENRRQYADSSTISSLQVLDKDVLKAIRSFPAGSAGGPDGIRPKHLLDLVNCKTAGQQLLSAITAFINMLLEGKCHPQVTPFLFGGKLIALTKKCGGIRPIAIGYTWRRIASKCANAFAMSALSDHFLPIQLGIGTSGGCEAAIHAVRRYVQSMPADHIVAKLDFSNAFNSLHRDAMLESVHNKVPELYKFCVLSYGQSTVLHYGSRTVLSQEGTQQGDPLGPLLFCLTLQPLLSSLSSELVIGYIDDVTLGGTVSSVSTDVQVIKTNGAAFGLHLNTDKCELIAANFPVGCPTLDTFTMVQPENMTLLGAVLFISDSLDKALKKKLDEFNRLSVNLRLINAHDALLITRFALSTSVLLHLLRCSPCVGHPTLLEIDNLLRSNISHIANVNISNIQWLQTSLPTKVGGLGIRRASSLSLPAFLASYSGTKCLQDLILLRCVCKEDLCFDKCLKLWSTLFHAQIPQAQFAGRQRAWDKPIVERDSAVLFSSLPGAYDQARLRAISSPHSSDWLHALPIASCGLRLDDETVRVAIGFRLGTAICQPHECPCGAIVQSNGFHVLSCKYVSGRRMRHEALNNIIFNAMHRADIPSVKEPPGLSRTDGKRPDGLTLIPWQTGKCVTWDVTVADTMAQSYISASSKSAGGAANLASIRKEGKYADLTKNYIFAPIAIETFGSIGVRSLSFLSELGKKISSTTGDIKERSFLFQRLSITIQHFNSVCFKSSFRNILGLGLDDTI